MILQASRRLALEAALDADGLDAALITARPNIRYLTGFTGSSGALWLSRVGAPTLITDFRYDEQARDEVSSPTAVHIARGPWMGALSDVVRESVGRCGFEAETVTVADHERLAEILPDVELVPLRDLVETIRRVKDSTEIEAIERAVRVAETALNRTLSGIDWHDRPTERSVAVALELELRRQGSEALPFDAIVASGPRSALPHAMPSDREIEMGDLVLIDFGARVDGYCSDITRTFVVGAPADWQSGIHAHVLEAQELARSAALAGAACRSVDARAREALARHDEDQYFGHSTGHGIGLEVHEGPSLATRSEDSLEVGNVVTVEPGVYLPGKGGVRIEDDVLVAETGPRTLTNLPRELTQL
ncbi:MAG: Xaa-Pro peptidase family protein [Gemmatimonadetes bacterium]|nr:Xaa-Pro peptidase family protein [Gemmatimonadota bacterium]